MKHYICILHPIQTLAHSPTLNASPTQVSLVLDPKNAHYYSNTTRQEENVTEGKSRGRETAAFNDCGQSNVLLQVFTKTRDLVKASPGTTSEGPRKTLQKKKKVGVGGQTLEMKEVRIRVITEAGASGCDCWHNYLNKLN